MVVSLLVLASALAATPAEGDCKALTGDAKLACDNKVALEAAQDGLVALGDCTKLDGEAKTTCDGKKIALATQIAELRRALAPATDTKGSKAGRGNSRR
jgi:hypothetical protein